MVKTFNQREKELQRERRDEDEGNPPDNEEYTQRTPLQRDGETLEELADRFDNISVPIPEWLQPERGPREDLERIERNRQILVSLEEQFGVDLGNILSEIENISDVDLADLSQTELLTLVVRLLSLMSRMRVADLSIQTTQTEALLDIATSVEPSRAITVTGVNVIEDADTPEPLIPQSDKTDIPTRVLRIRADPLNDKPIAIGDDEIDPDEGWYLKPGESDQISIDFRRTQLYMASEEDGQSVRLLGLF